MSFDDRGLLWEEVTENFGSTEPPESVFSDGPLNFYVLTSTQYDNRKSTDGGQTWVPFVSPTPVGAGTIRSHMGYGESGLLLVPFSSGSSTTLYRSINGGASWTSPTGIIGQIDYYACIASDKAGNIVLLNWDNLYLSTDFGQTFTDVLNIASLSLGSCLYVVYAGDDTFVAFIGSTAYRSTDGGATWSPTGASFDSQVVTAAASDDGVIICSTYSPQHYISTDGGLSFAGSGYNTNYSVARPRSGPIIWLGGSVFLMSAIKWPENQPKLVRTEDNGTTWEIVAEFDHGTYGIGKLARLATNPGYTIQVSSSQYASNSGRSVTIVSSDIESPDSITFSDTHELINPLILLSTDSIDVGETSTLTIYVDLIISEKIDIGEAVTIGDIVNMLISEGIYVSEGGSALSRPEPIQYSVNLITGAASAYTGFGFNGFVSVDGISYGWRSDGLYKIGAETDDGENISALVDFGVSDYGNARIKTISTAWLGVRTDGQVYVKAIADDGREVVYRATASTDTHKAIMAKGVSGRQWSLVLEIADASFASLDSVELEVGISQRRFGRR